MGRKLAGAIYLILELQRGTHDIVRITSEPMLHAIDLIARMGSREPAALQLSQPRSRVTLSGWCCPRDENCGKYLC